MYRYILTVTWGGSAEPFVFKTLKEAREAMILDYKRAIKRYGWTMDNDKNVYDENGKLFCSLASKDDAFLDPGGDTIVCWEIFKRKV